MIFTRIRGTTVSSRRASRAMRVVQHKGVDWRNTKGQVHLDLTRRIKIKSPYRQIKI